jgi:hypothetical protein
VRRRRNANLRALREEAAAQVAVVFYATKLGGRDPGWCGYTTLSQLAEQLGVEPLPSMDELVEDPDRVDAWASRCGLVRR